jgi:hypothetical protein
MPPPEKNYTLLNSGHTLEIYEEIPVLIYRTTPCHTPENRTHTSNMQQCQNIKTKHQSCLLQIVLSTL